MAIIRPFRGLRPLPQYAAQVASRPYDILSSDEARREAEGNPLSFLHVGKPEIDLPRDIDPYDDQVYLKGKKNLEKLIEGSTLRQDPQPCLYVYSQTMGDRTQYGVVGCVSVQDYLNGTIRKHELTRKDKEDDRTRHIKATNAHTGPVLVAYRQQAAIDKVVDHISQSTPIYDFIADDGIRHQLWVIADQARIQSLVSTFAGIPHLYIADGHHRSAAAVRVALERKAMNPHHSDNGEHDYFLAVLFPHTQLKILDYNRVARDLNGMAIGDFLEAVGKSFAVDPSLTEVRPGFKGEFGMYLGARWYRLTVLQQFLPANDPVERLDVSILQNLLLAPVLGIKDPRTDRRIDFVGGIRGLGELERRVNSGEMAVAFSLHPTSMEELFAVADADRIMPPKSTWFEPKLRDGLVVHLIG